MSIQDDMFKSYDARFFINPHNPLDPSTPYGRDQLNRPLETNEHATGSLKGWKRIGVLAALLGWFILVGTWTPS